MTAAFARAAQRCSPPAACSACLHSAETYPAHPIRLVVPFAAGGPTDVIARIVAQKLSEAWGQQVYTENVPGAGGNTGMARSPRRRPTATPCSW